MACLSLGNTDVRLLKPSLPGMCRCHWLLKISRTKYRDLIGFAKENAAKLEKWLADVPTTPNASL
jgi:hypothetical protein